MSYDFVAASTQRIEANSSFAALSFPITLSCWTRPDLTGTRRSMFFLPRATLSSYINLRQGSADTLSAVHAYGGTTAVATSSSAFSAGTWYHLLGVFNTASSRSVYIDGSLAATDTSPVTTGTFKTPLIGCAISSSTFVDFFDGKLAECAVWSVALTADEITSLAKGFKPTRIRPQSLVYYAPFTGDANDLKDNVAPTLTNSPTADSLHPRRYG